MKNKQKYVNISTYAKLKKVCRRTVYNWLYRGEIKAETFGGNERYIKLKEKDGLQKN